MTLDAGPTGCQIGFIGDRNAEPELVITALGADGISRELHDGDGAPLIFPPQGGRVIFAGVRANNVHGCGAQLTGLLREDVTNQLRLDGRTTNLRRFDGGGGGSVDTNTSTFTNIPVCPNQWSITDLFGADYTLEVRLDDREGRTITRQVRVRPSCAEPEREAECRCICQKDYVLGMQCGDGGVVTTDGGL